ncbi:MAG: hypothetical protein WC960_05230 [Bacteroidales bacterium]
MKIRDISKYLSTLFALLFSLLIVGKESFIFIGTTGGNSYTLEDSRERLIAIDSLIADYYNLPSAEKKLSPERGSTTYLLSYCPQYLKRGYYRVAEELFRCTRPLLQEDREYRYKISKEYYIFHLREIII